MMVGVSGGDASSGPMAIVHEWVSSCGGAEKVFARFAGLWPDADLYALTVDPDQTFIPTSRPIRTSGLDNRWGRSHRAMTLPLMARAWRQMMSGSVYDKVLVSHHALATSALRHVKARHTFAYVHTPARYFWNPEVDTRGAGIATAPVRHLFCRFDRRNAASVEAIAVNSHAVAQRVRTHWGRTAQVIAPPVDVDFFHPGEETRQGFILGASRFVPYKRLDLVIAAGEATRMPVVLAGAGPAETELRKLADAASVPVSFVIQPSAEQLRSLYRQASVFVFLALEDFGIMPVEAQACGTPVVALAAGGSLDTVSHGESGILVSDTSAPALDEAVNKAAGLSPQACRRHACRFAPDVFDQAIRDWVS